MWSMSSRSSGAVRESILMNLRIAEVKGSRSLSHCPHSEIFCRSAFIFAFSSNLSVSYLWDNCISHSSLTLPVALSSYSFSYRLDRQTRYLCTVSRGIPVLVSISRTEGDRLYSSKKNQHIELFFSLFQDSLYA